MSSPIPVPDPGAPPEGAPPPAPPSEQKKRGFVRRWTRRVLKTAIYGALFSIALVGALAVWILWFFPNSLATSTAIGVARDMGIELSIGSLDVRPLDGVTLEGVTVDVPANRGLGLAPLVSVGKVDVRWDVRAAVKDRRVHVTKVEIEDPHLRLDSSAGAWNFQRVLDVLAPPVATPSPAPTPEGTPIPLESQLALQVAAVDSMLAMVPVQVDLDSLHVRSLGIDLGGDTGTIARVDGIGVRVAAHLVPGAGTVSVELEPEPGITISAQPGGELGFSGTLKPATFVTLDLPDAVALAADIALVDGLVVAPGMELPLAASAKGTGDVDVPNGDVTLVAEKLDLGGFLDAAGRLEIEGFGVKGIRGRWNGALRSKSLPGFVKGELVKATSAQTLNAGGTIEGSLEGRLETADPTALAAAFSRGHLPLTLAIESRGASEDDLLAMEGLSVGKLAHRASIAVTPERIALDAALDVRRVTMAPLLAGKPFSIAIVNELEVPASLDAIRVETAKVTVPEAKLAVEGRAKLAGLAAALAAYSKASAKSTDTIAAALAAITAMTEIDASGTFRFASPDEELELASGAFLRGTLAASGSLKRRADPYGRVTGEVVYTDFGARIPNPPPAVPKEGEPAPKPTPPDALVVEGMNARLVMDRELILGGRPRKASADEEIAADTASVFDPATRGYYDRLGSLRAASDNFRIARIVAPPLAIRELSAEVLYDGAAIRVNRGRMQLLGGEVVGRAILRPTAEGLNVALAGDLSGIDMSPLLLERPVDDPNDTRVHMSSAASFFLSKEDPVASLADARMRLDVTAAGSKVLDTLLAWLDPEFKDPMFNWARSVNKKVVGVTRPQFTAVADHGMYDVTIGFPSLGVSKDVKRIPLRPLLDLKFTREITGAIAPPGELLPYLAARGIDQDGNVVLPVVRAEPER